jgi:hypothetical protein
MGNAYVVLVDKSEERRPLGIIAPRRDDNLNTGGKNMM